jgi:hypothetical protein
MSADPRPYAAELGAIRYAFGARPDGSGLLAGGPVPIPLAQAIAITFTEYLACAGISRAERSRLAADLGAKA